MEQTLHQIVRPLIDHDAIRAAAGAVQTAIERSKAAEADLAAAKQAQEAAHGAHQAALHEGVGKPALTKRALAEAEEALELAQEISEARERARVQANTEGVEKARRQAYGKVMVEGVRRRMNAIAAAPAAHKALAGAEAEYALGTAMLNEARANGVVIPDEVFTSLHGMRDHRGEPFFARTEAQEQAVWGHMLDIARIMESGKPTR